MCNEVNSSTNCAPDKAYCSCLYTYEFDLNEVVEFVIVDEGFTFQPNHPMHLHGHRYVVLGIEKVSAGTKQMWKVGNIKFHINSVSIQLTWSIFLYFFQNKIIDDKSKDGAMWSILCSILPYMLRIKKK
jgi:hypothetical protein